MTETHPVLDAVAELLTEVAHADALITAQATRIEALEAEVARLHAAFDALGVAA